MPTKYLLPCQCGAKTPVEKSQAGQSVTCSCGSVLAVPTFREMAHLERVEQAAASDSTRGWSPLQGMVFSSGLVIAVAGLLAAAFFAVQRAGIPTDAPAVASDSEEFARHLDEASPLEIYEEHWKQIEEHGLGPWQPPMHVMLREVRAVLLQRILYCAIAAIVGACLAGSSFFLGSRGKA